MQKIGFLLLCGGKSSRMGTPKALLQWQGEPLVQRVARAGADFPEKIFSVNGDIPVPAGFRPVGDVYPGGGPMAGLHAGLSVCESDALVTAPCDTPFYTSSLARFLARQYSPEWDAVILQGADGWLHPLMGVFSKSCLPAFADCLAHDKLKLMRTLDELHTKRLTLPPEISQDVFINLNTPEAYQRYQNAPGESDRLHKDCPIG